MSYLIMAVVFVAMLCLLDLLLTFAVIRRLRQHTALLSQRGMQGPPREVFPAGSAPSEFEAVDTQGGKVPAGWLAGRTVVAFFSTRCGACEEQLPVFVEVAEELKRSEHQVLAVVIGDGAEATAIAGTLEPVARVVVEPLDGPIALAFGGVRGTPSFAMIDESGMVTASGHHISELPLPATL